MVHNKLPAAVQGRLNAAFILDGAGNNDRGIKLGLGCLKQDGLRREYNEEQTGNSDECRSSHMEGYLEERTLGSYRCERQRQQSDDPV